MVTASNLSAASGLDRQGLNTFIQNLADEMWNTQNLANEMDQIITKLSKFPGILTDSRLLEILNSLEVKYGKEFIPTDAGETYFLNYFLKRARAYQKTVKCDFTNLVDTMKISDAALGPANATLDPIHATPGPIDATLDPIHANIDPTNQAVPFQTYSLYAPDGNSTLTLDSKEISSTVDSSVTQGSEDDIVLVSHSHPGPMVDIQVPVPSSPAIPASTTLVKEEKAVWMAPVSFPTDLLITCT